MSELATPHIQSTNAKRLIKDIKDILKNPLHNEGVFYQHDTDEMLKGYAMIIGPTHGVYANGIYFFKFNFPTDYPFSPPLVEYCTNDGTTRFNPNLYRQGKVCLSILNTWEGDSWTSCQTIRSVLLQLLLLFHDKPLLNEPGVTSSHNDFKNYHDIIEYKNLQHSIYFQLKYKKPFTLFSIFEKDIAKHIKTNIDDIINNCETLSRIHTKPKTITTTLYNMKVILNYPNLLNNLHILKKRF